jgi:hypothetical protein
MVPALLLFPLLYMKRGPLGGPLFGFRRFIRFKGFRGGGIAAFGGDEFCIPLCRMENLHNRAYGPWKCTPIPACGGASPGGGSLLYAPLELT